MTLQDKAKVFLEQLDQHDVRCFMLISILESMGYMDVLKQIKEIANEVSV